MKPACVDDACLCVPASTVANEAALVALLEGVVERCVLENMKYLRRYPDTTYLYQSSIRYVDDSDETAEQRVWTIPIVGTRGRGACADLAAWRCAELRMEGIRANVRLVPQSADPSNKVFHAVVATPRGYEDPASILTMRNG